MICRYCKRDYPAGSEVVPYYVQDFSGVRPGVDVELCHPTTGRFCCARFHSEYEAGTIDARGERAK